MCIASLCRSPEPSSSFNRSTVSFAGSTAGGTSGAGDEKAVPRALHVVLWNGNVPVELIGVSWTPVEDLFAAEAADSVPSGRWWV